MTFVCLTHTNQTRKNFKLNVCQIHKWSKYQVIIFGDLKIYLYFYFWIWWIIKNKLNITLKKKKKKKKMKHFTLQANIFILFWHFKEKCTKFLRWVVRFAIRQKLIWFGFFVFNGISIFMGYLKPKPSLYKNSISTIKLQSSMLATMPQGSPTTHKVDLGVMAIEEYFTFLRNPELEPHYHRGFFIC